MVITVDRSERVYKRIVVASQIFQRLAAHCLKLRFAVERHVSPGLFATTREQCLILAPTHQTVLDPWLIAVALDEKADLSEKVQGHLDALRQGDVVLIFPEGGLWKKNSPPVGPFAPGAVYLQRQSGAAIVPMAVWMDKPRWPRRRYVLEIGYPVWIPESLDLESGASWLRERVLELHERAARRGE